MVFVYKASEKATGMTTCRSSQMPAAKRHDLPLPSNTYTTPTVHWEVLLLLAFPLVCRGRYEFICNTFLQPLRLQGHGWRVVWALYNKKEISWLGLTLHLSWATGLQLCHLHSQVRWNWILLIFTALSNYLFIYNVYIFQNDLIWDATAWSIMDY